MTWFKIIAKFLIGILLVVLAVALGPLLIIWAINTLFPTASIPYSWETWAAAFILSAPFSSGALRKKS